MGLFRRLLSSRPAIALLLIFAMGAFLRFFAIGSKTVWLDEAFSIWVANHGIVEGTGWLIKIDQHPPLYYSLLSIWQWFFGDVQAVVRAFSALCSTLAIPFIYLATKRITQDTMAGVLAALFLALSPFQVRFAQEARMYALLTMETAIALFFLVRYLDGYGTRRLSWRDYIYPRRWSRMGDVRAAVGLSLAQAAIMLTHNTAAVFFPLALNASVFGAILYQRFSGRHVSMRAVNADRFMRNWLVIQAVAFLLWLPWAIPFVIQSIKVDQEFWIGAPDLMRVVDTLKNLSFAHLPDWIPTVPLLLFYALLTCIGVFYMRQKAAWALLLLSLLLTPFVGELLVSLRRPIFYDRTLIWTTLPLIMLMAIGIRGCLVGPFATARTSPSPVTTHRSVRRAAAAIASAVLVIVSTFSIYNYYMYFEKEDWAEAADYVAQNIEAGDTIIFNATWVQIPFEYYFRHYDIETDLRGAPVDLFDRGVLEPKMTEDDIPSLQALIQGENRVWLVYSHDWYSDPQQIIPRQLREAMRQTDQRAFVGLQIMEFER
jgi:mannosyltransferase